MKDEKTEDDKEQQFGPQNRQSQQVQPLFKTEEWRNEGRRLMKSVEKGRAEGWGTGANEGSNREQEKGKENGGQGQGWRV